MTSQPHTLRRDHIRGLIKTVTEAVETELTGWLESQPAGYFFVRAEAGDRVYRSCGYDMDETPDFVLMVYRSGVKPTDWVFLTDGGQTTTLLELSLSDMVIMMDELPESIYQGPVMISRGFDILPPLNS